MKAGGKGYGFRECSTSSLPLPPPSAFHLLSPFFCSTRFFVFPLPEFTAPAILSGSLEQLVARKAHNLEVAGSSPAAATTDDIVNTPLKIFQQKYRRNSGGISVYLFNCKRA